MADDLIRVRPKSGRGGETFVSRDWLNRWPEDFEPVEQTTAPEGGDQAAPAAPTTPSGGKKKEN